jgi:choline-sulfatase
MRILYLDIDTLRPDHLGCYGYGRNTSPNIDHIASDGVRFEGCYGSDAPCLPARAALMSGQFGVHTGAIGHGGTAADFRLDGCDRGLRDKMAAESMAATLRSAGFKTASVSPFGERHAAWWFYAGFNEMFNTGKGRNESAEDVTPAALKWIEANAKDDNWFLHINYWDPHTPYRAPEEFGDPFAGDPLPAWLTEEVLAEHRTMVGPHKAREISMYGSGVDPNFPRQPGELEDMSDVRRMIDGYDCGTAYADKHVGIILDALDKQGVLDDDLAIIVSSDHGENQGELGIYGEHATADHTTCNIPLIIKWPGGQKGHVDRGLRYNLDLLPTLADLLSRPRGSTWDGTSYADTVRSGAESGREHLVISQCAHVCQRSVRFGPWLYMRTYHDGYHLFPQEMLYDIEKDPHEQHDLASERPEVCRQAAHTYLGWHDSMMASAQHQMDPMWTVMREGGPFHAKGALREYCKYLEATDRGNAIEELKRRHPQEFA